MKKLFLSFLALALLSSCGQGLTAFSSGGINQSSIGNEASKELFKIKNLRVNGATARSEFSIYTLNTPQSL
ncbi:MAG: hypothetical protein VX642_01325 [Bdellovibrionota bacterium]|nr:hypothetical protein [Bdellovibrionota bacterium]